MNDKTNVLLLISCSTGNTGKAGEEMEKAAEDFYDQICGRVKHDILTFLATSAGIVKSSWPEWLHDSRSLDMTQRLSEFTKKDVSIYVYDMSVPKVFSPAVSVWSAIFGPECIRYYHTGMVNALLDDLENDSDQPKELPEEYTEIPQEVYTSYMRKLGH